jgi:PiT family inorganic phosphate transporter
MSALTLLVILIGLALVFDFLNGFNDSANLVATMISSRAMTGKAALTMVAIAEFIGPFILGVAVARTIGTEVASPQAITFAVLVAALLSASLWNLITWYFGIPSSSSHALIGGILGAVALSSGLEAIHLGGVWKVGLALFISPVIGFLGGLLLMFLVLFLAQGATPKVNIFFKQIQIPTVFGLALTHGGNDAQKTMGIITLGLLTLGFQQTFVVPWWVILLSATAMAAGTAMGGWRIIHTLGGKFYRIRPIHSFTSQLTSGLVVLGASLLGGPVSTSHVVSSSIVGVGTAQRRSQVRWGVMADIMVAWLLTIPAAAIMAALLYLPLKFLVE